ncbi:MAG: M23 family metallopeptidase [Chloroflexota bacterium]
MKSNTNRIPLPLLRINRYRNAYVICFGILLFLASSCSSTPLARPTSTPVGKKAQSTQAVTAPTLDIEASSTAQTISASLPNTVCSPLAIQPLDKLSKMITQPFIMPLGTDVGGYTDGGHHGLDVGFNTRGMLRFIGTPILAAVEGKVSSIIYNRPPYGNMVILETTYDHIPQKVIINQKIPAGDSLYVLYAHMQNLQPLKIGQVIKCGHLIAEAGLSGITSGPHLHFETRWGPPDAKFPVMGAYRGDVTPDEMKYYKIWRMSRIYKLFDPFVLLNP